MKWSPHATKAIRDLVELLAVVERDFQATDEIRETRERRQAWIGRRD